jgi:hypothetical protein
VGSIPDGVIGIFDCHNPFVRTVALRNEYEEASWNPKGLLRYVMGFTFTLPVLRMT